MRRVWQSLTVLSILAALSSIVYLWGQLQPGALRFAPRYLAAAAAIYVVTYAQRMWGWQATATYFFGRLPLRDNAEAVAASTLVKFLPTVAWYIANRVHFYTRRGIPARAVVAASLFELVAMTASGAVLYGAYWCVRHASAMTFAIAIVVLLAVAALCRPHGALRAWWHERIHRNIVAPNREGAQQRQIWRALLWYGSSWIVSFAFFWAVCSILVPLGAESVEPMLSAWLLANLANSVLTLTLGAVPIAREVTLSVLLAQWWAWPVALAAVALVKIFFTLGDLLCSAAVLGWLHLTRRNGGA
jgi:hypothetical protein